MSHLVDDLATVLGVAAVTGVIARLLRQSSVLAYLLAGLVVGPYIPIPLFADPERIHELSEFGVVLVMFAVGLEFSLRRLVRMLPVAGFTGLMQICTLLVVGFAVGQGLGFSVIESVFLGGTICISSTMIVAKVFDENSEPRTRELVFGILVVQDLAAILIVAMLTAVASGAGLSSGVLVSTLGNLVAVLVLLVVVGLLVVPRFVRFVDDRGSAETVLVGAVAVCFVLAALADHWGYSVALGAFVAGMLVAEAGRTHRIEALVHPLRDLFSAVFLVSVGMSVDPRLVAEHAGLSVTLALVVIVGQLIVVSAAGVVSGNGVGRSVTAGLALGQIGEFAFIIAAIGASAGVVGDFLQPVAVTVAVLTSFTTPILFGRAGRLAHWVERMLPRSVQTFASLCESWFESIRQAQLQPKRRSHLRNSAIVLGIDGVAIAIIWVVATVWGPAIDRWLAPLVGLGPGVRRLMLWVVCLGLTAPLLFTMLRAARRAGTLLAERVIPLRSQGTDLGHAPRRALMVALQSMVVLAIGVPIVTIVTPFIRAPWGFVMIALALVVLCLHIWRSAADLQGHVRAGASALVEVFQRQMSVEPKAAPTREPHGVVDSAAAQLFPGLGHPVYVEIDARAWACGRTLSELHLRATTGATIVAIVRGETTLTMPSGSDVLGEGDKAVLLGSDEALEEARVLLERPH